jgi:hypothetical protein
MPAIALEVQEEMQCVQKMGECGSKKGKEGQQTLTAEKPHDADPGGIVCLLTHALDLGEAGARVCECVSKLSWPERVKYREGTTDVDLDEGDQGTVRGRKEDSR